MLTTQSSADTSLVEARGALAAQQTTHRRRSAGRGAARSCVCRRGRHAVSRYAMPRSPRVCPEARRRPRSPIVPVPPMTSTLTGGDHRSLRQPQDSGAGRRSRHHRLASSPAHPRPCDSERVRPGARNASPGRPKRSGAASAARRRMRVRPGSQSPPRGRLLLVYSRCVAVMLETAHFRAKRSSANDSPAVGRRPFTPASGSADRREQVVARLLAAAAHLGASAAVLVVLGVALALLATGAACHHARLNRCADDADIRRALAGDDTAGGLANVSAVEAQANAAHQLLQVGLAEVGVGAARTRGGAVDAALDTANDHIAIATCRLRMRLEHLSNRHFHSLGRGARRRMRQVTSLVQTVAIPPAAVGAPWASPLPLRRGETR
jgi:hypothetical protein